MHVEILMHVERLMQAVMRSVCDRISRLASLPSSLAWPLSKSMSICREEYATL
jgi:hypothetical protein